MTLNSQSPNTVFLGQNGQVRVVSRSHGAIRPNMVQSVDYTPKGTIKQVDEWDNPEPALLYQTFDGGSGKVSVDINNQAQVEAFLMDRDATAAPAFTLDPANNKPFTLAINHKGLDGVVKGFSLLKGCLAQPMTFSGAIKDGAKGEIAFQFLNGYRGLGLALQYNRANLGIAQTATPSAPTASNSTTTGFLVAGTYYIRIVAKTAVGDSLPSPEYGVVVPAGTATNKLTVTTPAPSGSVLTYDVYISNRSGGERFVGNDAGASSLAITNLPALTAAACPTENTSASPVCTDDMILASSPYAITFPRPVHFDDRTGLGYALVMKNGVIVASPNHVADVGEFHIKSDGTQFILEGTPSAQDWWDIFTTYQP
jgi:hypothetical protein